MMTRFFILAVLFSLLSLASAQAVRPANISLCVWYTQALNNGTDNAANEYALISAVVSRAALGGTFNVSGSNYTIDGIVAASPASGATNPIINYFNGQIQFRAGAPDYTRNGFNNTDFASLASKLFSYFGALLGCNYIGTTPFAALGTSDMYNVHKNMTINRASEAYFDNAVARSLTSFGVSQADINGTAGALGYFDRYGAGVPNNTFIDGTKLTQICNQADCPPAVNANQALYATIGSSSSTGGTGSPVIGPTSSSSTGNGAMSTVSVSVAMVLATLIAVVSLVL